MIAPAVAKTLLVVGAVGEAATLVVAQVSTTVDTTAVWVAGIGFLGLMVTSLITVVNQRATAKEQREFRREQREAEQESKKTMKNVEHLVNSSSDEQKRIISELRAELRQANATALAKAEAAPALPSKETDE